MYQYNLQFVFPVKFVLKIIVLGFQKNLVQCSLKIGIFQRINPGGRSLLLWPFDLIYGSCISSVSLVTVNQFPFFPASVAKE